MRPTAPAVERPLAGLACDQVVAAVPHACSHIMLHAADKRMSVNDKALMAWRHVPVLVPAHGGCLGLV